MANSAAMENGFETEKFINNVSYHALPAPTAAATTGVRKSLSHTFKLSWWEKRSVLEKMLIICLIITTIVAIVMVIVVAAVASKSKSNQALLTRVHQKTETPSAVCLTQDCVQAAARMLESMDQSVDPCTDFYDYACGTWNRINLIPDDRPSYSTFLKLRDELQTKLKALLEEPVTKNETHTIQAIKNVYQSCINTGLIEERGDKPLREFLRDLGGWPMIDDTWNSDKFDLVELMARLRLFDNRILVNQWVGADIKQSNVNIIQLDQPKYGLPNREYFLGNRPEQVFIAYREFALRVAVEMGGNETQVEKDVSDILAFEVHLAKISAPDELRRDHEAMYRRFSVHELYTNLTNEIDWLRYLRLIFAGLDIEINETESVVVYATEYFKQLGSLLQKTPNRTVSNYMIWQAVMNRISFLPQSFINLRSGLKKALSGTDKERTRWRTCVTYVNDNNLGMAVGKLFVMKHFDEKAKENALAMVQDIRSSFIELLEQAPWMDDETRRLAKEKADSMQENIGYPDYILHNDDLEKDFEMMTIDPKKYFENALSCLISTTQYSLRILRDAVDKSMWATTPAIVNAFYNPTRNQITFPAAILQPPFYHENYLKSLNYGGIGMVIGHEITHGFDDKGRQFDKNGNLKQWWSNAVIDEFKRETQCIIDQYSNYTVEEISMNLNGKQTQGENIADNGGLKQAYRAYRKWVETNGREEDVLPSLNLSGNQLFFLNFAQIWCGSARPESLYQSVTSDRHCPGKYRVIGSLSNLREFAETYNCPLGSAMNPLDKCRVW